MRLNRRFAPDVYLGVADVLDPAGDVCESLVVMRRLPAAARLSTLVRSGVDVSDPLRTLARRLAAFHATARHDHATAAEGTRDATRGRWRATFEQTRADRGTILDAGRTAEVERLALRYLEGREPLFAARVAAGLVRDGHGDLLADDVFVLPDGPRVLDCLEFDDRLRYVDGIDDAAFLAMDLEHLGAPEAARTFLDRYAEFAGVPRVPSLEHHYIAYRAFVRAKIACLRARREDEQATTEARAYTELALRHLRAGRVVLVLVGGLPGTGKSTVAGLLADGLGAVLLRSDRVRKELVGVAPENHAAAPYRAGIYRPDVTETTYAGLLDHPTTLLGRGVACLLDAFWSARALRVAAASVARPTAADLVELRCEAPPEVAAERMRARTDDPSDADAAVATAMAADADPWPSAIVVDTTCTVEASVATALLAVRMSEEADHDAP